MTFYLLPLACISRRSQHEFEDKSTIIVEEAGDEADDDRWHLDPTQSTTSVMMKKRMAEEALEAIFSEPREDGGLWQSEKDHEEEEAEGTSQKSEFSAKRVRSMVVAV